jgi:hypothetical protein
VALLGACVQILYPSVGRPLIHYLPEYLSWFHVHLSRRGHACPIVQVQPCEPPKLQSNGSIDPSLRHATRLFKLLSFGGSKVASETIIAARDQQSIGNHLRGTY